MKMASVRMLGVYFFSLLIVTVLAQQDELQARRFLNDRLENYDKEMRPGADNNRLSMVELSAMITSLAMDDSTSPATMTYQGFLRARWQDARLGWGRSAANKVNLRETNKIWSPDLFVTNAAASMTSLSGQETVEISRDGTVLWSRMMNIPVSCDLDLGLYPFDSQECKIEFELYGYTTSDVRMVWKPEGNVTVTDGLMVQGWDIESLDVDEKLETLGDAGEYDKLWISVMLTRYSGYYTTHVHAPCIIIVIVSWVAFLINHQKFLPLRIAIGFITLLAMMYVGMGVGLFNAKVNYVTSIDLWIGFCFLFVLAAFLQLCFLVFFTNCCSNRDHNYGPALRSKYEPPPAEDGSNQPRKVRRFPLYRLFDFICLILFAVLFLIFNIIYWPAYMG